MFSGIKLGNFQSFENSDQVELAPITLIFGPNSSGKSALFRAFRFLKQSIELASPIGDASFSANGPSIQLTSYKNMVHAHEEDREISIEITLENPHGDRLVDGIRYTFDKSLIPKKISLHITNEDEYESETDEYSEVEDQLNDFWLHLERKSKTENVDDDSGDEWLFMQNSRPQYAIAKQSLMQFEILLKTISRQESSFAKGPSTRSAENSHERSTAEQPDPRKIRFYLVGTSPRIPGFDRQNRVQVGGVTMLRRHLDFFAREMNSLFRSMDYIGPLRAIPEKVFQLQDISDDSSRYHLGSVLASDPEALRGTSFWLSQLTREEYTLQYTPFTSKESSFLGQFGSLLLKDQRGNLITFEDAGTGLSQVLEVIEKITSASPGSRFLNMSKKTDKNSTILVEQPELHLHPRMQAELANLLVMAVTENPNLQILAETHSENLILRIQKLVRMGKIDHSMISVIYVDKDDSGGAKCKRFQLSPNGDFLDSWPESFGELRFNEAFGETLEK